MKTCRIQAFFARVFYKRDGCLEIALREGCSINTNDSLNRDGSGREDAVLVADQLGFAFAGGKRLFAAVSFSLGRRKVGLVGRNGVGKSHLLKILTGALSPSEGRVARHGRLAYLPQNVAPGDQRLVGEVLGVGEKLAALAAIEGGETDPVHFETIGDDWDIQERSEQLLAEVGLAGIDLNRSFASLSGGEATRLTIAGLMLTKPDLLILDEPTNNLDGVSKQALYRLLEGWRGGLLIVSHDRALLNLLDRILELTTLGMNAYEGNYDHYAAQKEVAEEALRRNLKTAEAELKKTKKEIQKNREKHEQRQAKGRKERRGGSQPKVVMNARRERSEGTGAGLKKSADRQLNQHKQTLDEARAKVELLETIDASLVCGSVPNGKTVLALSDVGFAYPGAAQPLFSDVNLRMTGPERVRIKGPNGSGKTTLLKLIHQAAQNEAGAHQGTIQVGVPRFTYLDQHIEVLDGDQSILANFRAFEPELPESEVRWRLAKFLFPGETVHKKVASLSGGERLRAAMACLFLHAEAPQLLLLDEPTNHLDLDSIAALEAMLNQYQGALVVITHDELFAARIGLTRVLDLAAAEPSHD